MKQGTFIVLDGTDGSGKATQHALLAKRLKQEGYAVETISFPRYGVKSCAPVEEYLNGAYGQAHEVSPYIAGLLYMIDRFGARKQITQWLTEGKVVLSDRYAISNMGHQGGKIADQQQRYEFWDWLQKMEYGAFGNPKPDHTFILHVPVDISIELINQKQHRAYIEQGKKQDIHEADREHLERAEQAYLEVAGLYPDIEVIECAPHGTLLGIEEIHDILYEKVKKLLKF